MTIKILRPNFKSNLEHKLAFGTPKFYNGPYSKINHGLVNLHYTCNCDVVSSGLSNSLPLYGIKGVLSESSHILELAPNALMSSV